MSHDDQATTPTPPQATTPDVDGFAVPMSRVNVLIERRRKGETLTFEDGLVVAYAIGERLRDDLDQSAAGDSDDQIHAIGAELQALTGIAYWLAPVLPPAARRPHGR